VISKSQVKTLTNIILPRIALYDVLIKYEPKTAVSVMRKYMMDVVAYGKHSSTAKMEKIPGFFYIYKSVFLKIMRTTDLQVESGKGWKGGGQCMGCEEGISRVEMKKVFIC
jgi:hypothetical protein